MKDYEKRLEETCNIGCYFEDEQIFIDFLNGIEKLDGNEINYYYAFKRLLRRIVHHNAGIPIDPEKNDGKKYSFLPVAGGKNIKIIFQEEKSEDLTVLKQYKIYIIEIYENATLKEWPLKRYSSINNPTPEPYSLLP